MKRLAGFLVGMVGLALAVYSGGALAATECNTGPPGPPPFVPLSGTVVGGVVVNAGDFCFISGANISDGLRVNGGGILIVCGSTINGGFVSDGAVEIIFGAEEIGCDGDVINGGVWITNTGPGNVLPPGCTPDVDCGPSIAVERSVIHGAVHLIGNQGPIAVATNSISGGLFCRNNAFDLDDEGSPSVVTGKITCEFE